MENAKNRSVSHTAHHIYRVSTQVSVITSSTKLIDMHEGGKVASSFFIGNNLICNEQSSATNRCYLAKVPSDGAHFGKLVLLL